ncbi:Uncharacterised protein [Mycobacterium tuberculosis]|nr:Uncharacterised protein [Mycobacterium tuberculosis]
MTASARAVSRSANHTVTTIIKQEETVVTTKNAERVQSGCSPVLRGTKNSSAMIAPTATAASPAANTMCSVPSSNTTRQVLTRKKNSPPLPVPTSQVLAKIET